MQRLDDNKYRTNKNCFDGFCSSFNFEVLQIDFVGQHCFSHLLSLCHISRLNGKFYAKLALSSKTHKRLLCSRIVTCSLNTLLTYSCECHVFIECQLKEFMFLCRRIFSSLLFALCRL